MWTVENSIIETKWKFTLGQNLRNNLRVKEERWNFFLREFRGEARENCGKLLIRMMNENLNWRRIFFSLGVSRLWPNSRSTFNQFSAARSLSFTTWRLSGIHRNFLNGIVTESACMLPIFFGTSANNSPPLTHRLIHGTLNWIWWTER